MVQNRHDDDVIDPTAKKYVIGGNVARYITCMMCNKTSYNSEDIRNKYCGYCKVFHEGWKGESYIIGEREE